MENIIKNVLIVPSSIRLIPHLLVFLFSPYKKAITADLHRWAVITGSESNSFYHLIYDFLKFMTYYPEFRNLFYHRIGFLRFFLILLCRPMSSLYIMTKDIGPGLFIQHGFSTIISAKSIGKNCWINQQVTIGYSNRTDCPTIGDNVSIKAGAKIIGKVSIGDNSIVGANAVVVRSVPNDCTVVGIPAYIIKRNGAKCYEKL